MSIRIIGTYCIGTYCIGTYWCVHGFVVMKSNQFAKMFTSRNFAVSRSYVPASSGRPRLFCVSPGSRRVAGFLRLLMTTKTDEQH